MSSESTSGEHLIIRPGTGRVRSRAGSRPAAAPGGALEDLLKRAPRLAHQPVGEARVVADGVHLACEGRRFRVRGVTYGSFLPREDGSPFPEPRLCRHDLLAIADAGLNVVRTYSLPPRDLQETAAEQGLRLLVGLHYDDWRMLPPVGRRGRRQVRMPGAGRWTRRWRSAPGGPRCWASRSATRCRWTWCGSMASGRWRGSSRS